MQGTLRKELLRATFVERLKTATFRKSYWEILPVIILWCVVGPSCQYFGNAVNIKVGINIAIYIITESIGIKSSISKCSQVKCSILSFYCTVLFLYAKKTLETLQILLFASMFLSLVKKTASHVLFTVLSYVQGARQKRVWII